MQDFLQIGFSVSCMTFSFKSQPGASFNSKQYQHNLPELGKWTHVKVDQHKVAGEGEHFLLTIHIGRIQLYSEIFQLCKDFANVQVSTLENKQGSIASINNMVIKTNMQS